MSTKRSIAVAELYAPSRSIVKECTPSEHLNIVEFDENKRTTSTAHVDPLIFFAPKDLEPTQAFCATLRSRIGESAPLPRRAGRHVYLIIRQLLNAVRSMIIMPFDARGLRLRLDELVWGSRWRAPRSRMANV